MHTQSPLVVALEVAATACRLDCSEPSFAALLADRYAGFPAVTEPEFGLRVTVTAPPSFEVIAAATEPYARVGSLAGSLTISGPGFQGAFDETTGQGLITQPPDPAPLETLLSAIYAGRLLARGGCLLHAATIVGKAGALVFFGPSGSGKTTAAELVGQGVLTDEITAIRPSADGYVVSSVPWRGRPTEAPLAGLFRLRHAATTSVTRLSAVAAVRHLLPSVFFSRADAVEVDRFLDTAAALTRALPTYDLGFARERSFWDVVPGAV